MMLELNESGFAIGEETVAKILSEQGLMGRNGRGYSYFQTCWRMIMSVIIY